MRSKKELVGELFEAYDDGRQFSAREIVGNLAILVEVIADIRNILLNVPDEKDE